MRFFFFFNDTATTEIYTLSLHDALPILRGTDAPRGRADLALAAPRLAQDIELAVIRQNEMGLVADDQPIADAEDRKSTRLNSSHANISYAVFCLKKKKKNKTLHGTVKQL